MAIAYDNGSSGSAVATSLTYALTTAGSNITVATGINDNTASDTITSVSYAGAAQTNVDKLVSSGGSTFLYLWNKFSAASGTNNVVLNASPSTNMNSISLSINGASTTGPDAHGTVSSSIGSGASQTKSLTTVANNAWMLAFGHGEGDPVTAGANWTNKVSSGNAIMGIYSSNPVVTPASVSMSCVNSGAGPRSDTILAATYAPFVAAAVNSNFFFMM